ncbi:MAG TPA: MCE family protein [Thermomonospora sp.]|nr:MCE family protein [Thermomonospora sp.]
MRRLTTPATVLLLAASAGGCTVVGGPDTYRLTAYFARTPALYEQSRVKVMGADAGVITDITVEGRRVRVDLAMKRSVPVPADVRAAIVAANALGERSVVLHPPWKPGRPRARPGTVIPQERTELPVEIDEALDAFAKLNRSIDPRSLASAVGGGADALRGKGDDINRGLQATSTLMHDLAAHDERLVRLARDLRALAASLNSRDKQLTALIQAFSTTSRDLADERVRLQRFVSGLAQAIKQSDVLITAYQETLPSTVADLSNIVMTLKANAGTLNQTIEELGRFADVAVRAWDRERHVATIRLLVHGTVRAWLQPLFTALGWGTVPCLPGNPALGRCTPGEGRP